MQFFNCTPDEDKQNLVILQYHTNIYCHSFKHIYPINELYVWYGEQYARELGITSNFEEGRIIPWLMFVHTLVINLINVSTVGKNLIRAIAFKLMFVYTLMLNLTNVNTVGKGLTKAVISKLIFVYTLVINLTKVSAKFN